MGASALLLGAIVAYAFPPNRRFIAVVMALGSGLLIGSVAYELVDEALKASSIVAVAAWVLAGAAVFTIGDWFLGQRGGKARKDPTGAQADGSPLAIVLGSVLDGIPESFVLGLTVHQGKVSIALFAGIALSNVPEGMSSSSGLRIAGWKRSRVYLMWGAVILVSAISAGLGYLVLDPTGASTGGAIAQSFAAGALLAMVANSLLPESYKAEGVFTGFLVVAGFAISLSLQAF